MPEVARRGNAGQAAVQPGTPKPATTLELPPVREDLKLYPGPAHLDGSPSWRILDPLRNSFYEIGSLEFELLSRWRNHATGEALIEAVAQDTRLIPVLDEVRDLIEFLKTNQLLAPSSAAVRDGLRTMRHATRRAWYEHVFHHYLFFRVRLVRPDAFLGRTVGITDLFFTRTFAGLILGLLAVDLYLLMRDWHSFSESFLRLLTPQGAVYYAVALSFAKVIHELGHAYAAKRYGVRVPAMGVAFMVLWPFLYTDVGETWKLADRRKQLLIASAGMLAELTLAVIATFLWAISPEGVAKNVLFVLATSSWVMTLAINASPFMRFDGYFVLSDALDFPNLHERAGKCARHWIRTNFFRLPETLPEPTLHARQRRWLIAFAITTWIYRLVVFLGIALLVYHLFYKLLGIVLMLLEVYWFVLRPVSQELGYIWTMRRSARIAWGKFAGVGLAAVVALWFVPITSEVSAPGLLHAAQEQSVFPPFPARVTQVQVAPGQRVAAGDVLVKLESRELQSRAEKADVAIRSARLELARTPASALQQERQRVLEEELAQALATRHAVDEDAARQLLRANHGGIVEIVENDLVSGRSVNTSQLLMRVLSQTGPVIEAYVNEAQINAVVPGQKVRFYPEVANMRPMRGTIVAVDKTPLKEIVRPVMASLHGGEVVATRGANGRLMVQEALYRVSVEPERGAGKVQMAVRGTVRVETDLVFIAENFVYRILSLLIRESGI